MNALWTCGRPISIHSLFYSKGFVQTTVFIRSIAVISSPPSRKFRAFSEDLDSGPTLADFLSSSEHSSIPGTSHLPDWLKRPIPAGGKFAKIKEDLRGLNLHTGIYVLIYR